MEAENTAACPALSTEDMDLLAKQLLNIGEAMYYAGAEISRIEDTLRRVGKAYGAAHVSVYAITATIVLTMEFPGVPAITQIRRNRRDSTDLRKLEELNALCRRCTAGPLPIAELQQEVLKILQEKPDEREIFFARILAASAFTVFFGGNGWDSLAAGAVAALISVVFRFLKSLSPGQVYSNLFTSFIAGAAVCLLEKAFPTLHGDEIMIGDIMVLIPGVAITNSLRYTLSGDNVSGLEKLVDSLLQAAAIAAGYALALWLIRI